MSVNRNGREAQKVSETSANETVAAASCSAVLAGASLFCLELLGRDEDTFDRGRAASGNVLRFRPPVGSPIGSTLGGLGSRLLDDEDDAAPRPSSTPNALSKS